MILAEAMGPFIETPFPSSTKELFTECDKEFLALERGDMIGFAETNIRYSLGLTDLANNATLRQTQRSLFFQTSRMWLLLLPSMPWEETLEAVHCEVVEVIRQIVIGDPIGLGYTIRNHIFESEQRLFKALP